MPRVDNNIGELFEEFGSSMAANYITQGPGEVIDLRAQLLTGCAQCAERIAELMLPQDIACALTAGEFKFKEAGVKLLKQIADNSISLLEACPKVDGLVRAAGDASTVLMNLKKTDPKMFLQVLTILWIHSKER